MSKYLETNFKALPKIKNFDLGLLPSNTMKTVLKIGDHGFGVRLSLKSRYHCLLARLKNKDESQDIIVPFLILHFLFHLYIFGLTRTQSVALLFTARIFLTAFAQTMYIRAPQVGNHSSFTPHPPPPKKQYAPEAVTLVDSDKWTNSFIVPYR